MHRMLWAAGAVAGVAAGSLLLLFPVIAAPLPAPTVTIYTVSGGVSKVTQTVLGAPGVPIDVDGDKVPDVDVGVAITDVAFLPARPVAPTITVNRNSSGLALDRPSPPLRVEVIIATFDAQTSDTDTASFGFDTRSGGSIPARFQAALLSGIESTSLNPLEAAIFSPGYGGPLQLFSNVDLSEEFDTFSLRYDPLPEQVRAVVRKTESELTFTYEQTSINPEVDLEATVQLRSDDGSSTDLTSTVQRLPSSLTTVVTKTADGGGTFSYSAEGVTAPPDIAAKLLDRPAEGDPIYVEARVGGLPADITASWPGDAATTKRFAFTAPDPVGSLDFLVRNSATESAGPAMPPALRLPPTDHAQFVTRGEDFRAQGHVSLIREVSFEDRPDRSKVMHARLGDGAHPFRAGVDVVDDDGRHFSADSTVTDLPADLTTTFRPQDDADPKATPLLIEYLASAETDVVSDVTVAPSLDVGCRQAGTMCVRASVQHVPETLRTTFFATDVEGALRVQATPRLGGAQPDITTDVTAVPEIGESGDPLDIHAGITRFPANLVASFHLTGDEPDLVDLHSCDFDGSACAGEPDAIGKVNFRLRNFLGEGLGTDDLVPSDYLAVVSRGNDDPKRFEVSGQTSEIRSLTYRKVEQVSGLRVDMGSKEAFRAHVDLDSPRDPTDPEGKAKQQVVDALIDELPQLLSVCFRSPEDAAPVLGTDPDGITNPCQTDQAFGEKLTSTPFTVLYDAPGATPIVDTRAKLLFGGQHPVNAGERSDPDQTISISSRVERLPTHIRTDVQTDKDLGKDVPGRPLRFEYNAAGAVDLVTFDLAKRNKISEGVLSQCEDPRVKAESLCAHVDLEKLPMHIQGAIQTTPSKTSPLTRFQFFTSPDGVNTKIGCTGLATCGAFTPGLHLAKVKHPDEPLVVDAALQGLPQEMSGKLLKGIKGVEPDPQMTKLALEACRWNASDVCPSGFTGQVGSVRFAMQNFLVPDPIPAVPTAGQFFHFLKRDKAFRVQSAIAGFQGAVFTSPGTTTAVKVSTTPVDRDIGVRFDKLDPDGSAVALDARIEHLPPVLNFCFQPGKEFATPSGVDEGKFCDAAPEGSDDPAGSKAIRVQGVPGPGGKPNAFADFTVEKPGKVVIGKVTVLGLSEVIQATFDDDNVGFNRADPAFPVDPADKIDSIRFNVRNYRDLGPGDTPSEHPFTEQRFAGDPNTLPASPLPAPFISLVSNDTRTQAKGVINGVVEGFLFKEKCRNDGRPFALKTCKHLKARLSTTPAQTLGFFLSKIEGEKRKFITADAGPLTSLIDAFINTDDDGFDPKGKTTAEKVRLETDRPPLLQFQACDELPCTFIGGAPSIRGFVEIGKLSTIDLLNATPPRDPLFGENTPPNPHLGGPDVDLYGMPFVDPYYSSLDHEAAVDVINLNTPFPPSASSPDATVARIGKGPAGDKVVRVRLKLPFPAALTVDPPVMFSDDSAPNDPRAGQKFDDVKIGVEVRGFGPASPHIGLGRAVLIIDELVADPAKAANRGGETVILVSNIPGLFKLTKVEHENKATGQKLIDARGTGSEAISRMQMRQWSPADKNGIFDIAKSRDEGIVPNTRATIRNIPTDWRARIYTQEDISSDDGNGCIEHVYVIVNLQICVKKEYLDAGLDFHPSPGRPTAKRIDIIANSKGGKKAKIAAFDDTDAGEGAPAQFGAHMGIRMSPVDVGATLGIPFIAGALYVLDSDLDIHLWSIGQSSFELGFKEPAHLTLARDATNAGEAASGVDPGVYFEPIWDIDFMFGEASTWFFFFFSLGPAISSTLPLPAVPCGPLGLVGFVGVAFPELNALGDLITDSVYNGYELTGGSGTDSADLVLNVFTPPGVVVLDKLGGLVTRGVLGVAGLAFCAFDPPDLPVTAPVDPLPQNGAQPPPVGVDPTPPPPPPDVTVGPGGMTLCGPHTFNSLFVDSTLTVSDHANSTLGPDNQPQCLPEFVGTLKLRVEHTAQISPGATINATGVSLGEPAMTYDADHNPIRFPDAQGLPLSCGGGAGYGGSGGRSSCVTTANAGGDPYATSDISSTTMPGLAPKTFDLIYAGSPGAPGASPAGRGGGLVEINADRIRLLGRILASGTPGISGNPFASTCFAGAGGGGGSGGGILLLSTFLEVGSGNQLIADGGRGGNGKAGGGGGGGGRIKIGAALRSGSAVAKSIIPGGTSGPACGGVSPSGGTSGTFDDQGAVVSEARTLATTRTASPGAVTHWTDDDTVTVGTFSAASTGGGSKYDLLLCYAYEDANRLDGSKKTPDEAPLLIPPQSGGEDLDDYLRRLGCDLSTMKNLDKGAQNNASFTFDPGPQGYYGLFTVGGRHRSSSDTPCFTGSLSVVLAVDPDCQVEPAPDAPDVILAFDNQDPQIDQFELKEFGPFANIDDIDGTTFSNQNDIALQVHWTDGLGGVFDVSDSTVNRTTYAECFGNDEVFPLTCFQTDAAEPAGRVFHEFMYWPLTPGDGAKKVKLIVVDLAGNSLTAIKELTVDATKPSVAVLGPPAPASGWFKDPPKAIVAGDDVRSGLDSPGLFYIFDNVKDGTEATFVDPVTMPEGKHTMFGKAKDRIGNTKVTTDGYRAQVDTIRPQSAVSIVPGRPDGENGWYVTRPFVAFSGLDNVTGSGVKKLVYRTGPSLGSLGPPSPIPCSGDKRCLSSFLQLGDGTTFVCVHAEDIAGNIEGPDNCTGPINVDTVAPSTPSSAPPVDGEHDWHVTAPGTSVSASDSGSGVGGLKLRDLDVPFSGLWVDEDHTGFTLRPGAAFSKTVPEGTHDVRWFAEDSAGNRTTIRRFDFHVDLSDPVSRLSTFPGGPNPAGWYRTRPYAVLGATDGKDNSGVGSVTFGIDAGAVNAYHRPFEVAPGNHRVEHRAGDLAGRAETPRSTVLRVDVGAPGASPTVAPGPVVVSALGRPSVLAFTTSDDRAKITRALVRVFDATGELVRDLDAGSALIGARSVSWDFADNAGDKAPPGLYYYRVLVTDEAGNASMSGESKVFVVL